MRITRTTALVAFAACLLVPTLHATTYIVPTDHQMIESAQAIVTGTVIDKYCRRAADGSIETVTEVLVEERLKGGDDARTIKVVQWGGHLDHEWMVQSDAPEFARGEHVLLFVNRTGGGEWTTWSIGLGAFRFTHGPASTAILERSAIVGWNGDGEAHVERPRLEAPFLAYIRAIVRGEKPAHADYTQPQTAMPLIVGRPIQPNTTYTSAGYSYTFGDVFARRLESMLDVSWRPFGTVSGLDLLGAVDFANTQWNGQSPKITYSRGATASGDTKDLTDSEERVIANDPHGDISGTFPGTTSVVATAFEMCGGAECNHYTFNGDTFFPVTSSDVVVNDGVSSATLAVDKFNVAIAHELGHTLGLRHSNQLQDGSGTCAAPLDCCVNTPAGGNCKAIMLSSVVSGLTALQQWDKNAIDCLYDAVCNGGAVSFDPPTGVSAGATSGSSVTVSWTAPAGGTTPVRYDVYRSSDGTSFTQIGFVNHPTTTYPDNAAAADTAYLYKVRSADTGGASESSDSNKDFATTTQFTNDPITVGISPVMVDDIVEMRTAVNALRTLNGGQAAFAFTDPSLDTTTLVKAVHVTQLQTELNTVLTALGFSTVTFTNTPSAGSTLIQKVDIDELRAGVQ